MPRGETQSQPDGGELAAMARELRYVRSALESLLKSDVLAARMVRSNQADKERQAEKAQALANQARARQKQNQGG